MVGYLRGMNMTTTRVDSKHRIVIDKQTRSATQIKAGDTVIIVPLDKHSFKVEALDFTGRVEDDPAWQAIHKPVKIKKFIPPEKLEEIINETWLE
jgi:bifunctional DNA-binding transcriptional regulator/antitoxin component of YhaV-PrlF toxin-antitoxin module